MIYLYNSTTDLCRILAINAALNIVYGPFRASADGSFFKGVCYPASEVAGITTILISRKLDNYNSDHDSRNVLVTIVPRNEFQPVSD